MCLLLAAAVLMSQLVCFAADKGRLRDWELLKTVSGSEVFPENWQKTGSFLEPNANIGYGKNNNAVFTYGHVTEDSKKAFRVKITNIGTTADAGNVYLYKTLGLCPGSFDKGDLCVLKAVFKIKRENTKERGRIRFLCAGLDKQVDAGDEWVTAYMPFCADSASNGGRFSIYTAYYEQELYIRELSLINYENKLSVSDFSSELFYAPSDIDILDAVDCAEVFPENWQKKGLFLEPNANIGYGKNNNAAISCSHVTRGAERAFCLNISDTGTTSDAGNAYLYKTLSYCPGSFDKGDLCVFKIVFRIKKDDAAQKGKIRVLCAGLDKELEAGEEWVTAYMPFYANSASNGGRFSIYAAYFKQTLFIKELSLKNYKNRLSLSDFSSDLFFAPPAKERYLGTPISSGIIYGSNGKYAAGFAADEDGAGNDIYLAEYGENGAVISTKRKTTANAEKDSFEVLRYDTENDGNTLKAFIMENGTMKPLWDKAEMNTFSYPAGKKREVPVSTLTDSADMKDLYFAGYELPNVDENFAAGKTILKSDGANWLNFMEWEYADSAGLSIEIVPKDGKKTFSAVVSDTSQNMSAVTVSTNLSKCSEKYGVGDKCLIKLEIRAVDTTEKGRARVVVSGVNGEDAGKEITLDERWLTAYIPFEAKNASDAARLKLEIGGINRRIDIRDMLVMSYGKDVNLSDMPSSADKLRAECIYGGGTSWSGDEYMNYLHGAAPTYNLYTYDDEDGNSIFCVDVADTGGDTSGNELKTCRTLDDRLKKGDTALVKIVFRIRDAENESGLGKIAVGVEEWYVGGKFAYQELSAGEDWVTAYVPYESYKVDGSKCFVSVYTSFMKQKVDIKELSVMCYGTEVKPAELPHSINNVELVRECTTPNLEWRNKAIERIEKIRKGDMKIKVLNANGYPVEDAAVSVNMTEHEFEWGAALNGYAYAGGTSSGAEMYRNNFSSLFNSCVLEGAQHWNGFEQNTDNAHSCYRIASELGSKNMRGHAIIWDEKDLMPKTVTDAVESGDTDTYNREIEKRFFDACLEYYGDVNEWDVMNESAYHTYLRDKYGIAAVKQWFDLARKYAHPDTKLFYNEMRLDGKVFRLLDEMKAAGVDYDGIGVQNHRGVNSSIQKMYENLEKAAEYGKTIKITEFDMDEDDEILQGEATRDTLIACFSCEAVEGFYMWGFTDSIHWLKNAPIYKSDWSLKYSGQQYIDLVYNKWWTRESGATDKNGEYALRAYYGDYDITVEKDGIRETVSAKLSKGKDGEIVITLPEVSFKKTACVNFEPEGYGIFGSPAGHIGKMENGKETAEVGYCYGNSVQTGKTWSGNTFFKCQSNPTVHQTRKGQTGLNLRNILPSLTAGKTYKVTFRIYAQSAAGTETDAEVSVGRKGWVTWFEPPPVELKEKTTVKLKVNSGGSMENAKPEEWQTVEAVFRAGENDADRTVVIPIDNNSENEIRYGIDDICIYEEN